MSFSDLLRRALDAGLSITLDAWRRWRDMRNSTSHAHDEERALEKAIAARGFVADVDFCWHTLICRQRLHDDRASV